MLLSRFVLLFFMAIMAAMGQINSGMLTITPSPLLPAAIGLPYSQSLVATGGNPPYAWSISSGALPSDLTLSTNGSITGTPSATGTSEFTVTVRDSASATATQTFSIAVIAVDALIRFGTLSHVAAGGWWDTAITLINASSVPIAIRAIFRADDGTVLTLPLKLTQQGSSKTSTATSVNALLNPHSTVLIATGALPNTVIGWADVLSSGPVTGFAIMRSTPPNDKPSEATVPLQTSFPSSMTLPYDNTAGYVMGMALVNLATGSANITATIRDEDGTQLGVQQIFIPGNGHTSFALPDRLSLTTGKRGIIQFQSTSGGISGLGLRFSPFGPFTDVPVVLQQ
jgi:hypothetical protein